MQQQVTLLEKRTHISVHISIDIQNLSPSSSGRKVTSEVFRGLRCFFLADVEILALNER